MPMPIFSGLNVLPAAAASASHSRSARPASRRMSWAAATAFLAWSGSSSGAFQNAMMQSPIYLSIVPLCSVMISVIGDRNSLMKCVSVWASMPSDEVVKPRMSQNMIVMTRISPPSASFSGLRASSST